MLGFEGNARREETEMDTRKQESIHVVRTQVRLPEASANHRLLLDLRAANQATGGLPEFSLTLLTADNDSAN